MNNVVRAVELPPIDDPTKSFTAKVRIGQSSLIVHTGVMAKPTAVSVVLRATSREPQMELIPVVFFHVETDGFPEVEREFIVLPPGVLWDTNSDLEYRGSFHYPQGAIFFLFEVIRGIWHPEEALPADNFGER